MLQEKENKKEVVDVIVKEIIDHSISYAHNRHLSAQKCESIGLNIKHLESDQELQDKVLSIHHIYYHTLSSTPAFKIIENHAGKAFILQAQQMLIPNLGPAPQQGVNPVIGQKPAEHPKDDAQSGSRGD